ncbi:BirA family biotin operon repressor/biotin-[acetyl-CoA-carboxylase] ligase [Microbacterium sp. W4I4]|uniref:biotin--[acetyl-CoA-carboxylase] ligase n=1 Tax=Microbacterium sp. W4I4 TaxID=3042295 RepID=UPI002780DD68|nr:biotin--[acetyl-CoA-carboxylase] ligase [Microbacterium sp. W4I4]MDQ0613333.1 BirA family biotin operon repressor/biotin-[acetyl-CoA-carboxylase] ligase [Microbacterium sp. W4I4]
MDLTRSSHVASSLVVLPECASTNAELRERAADAAAWPHLSVLLTDSQTAGRGRLDRTWSTPPGSALAVSVLLRDLPADAAAWGWIPLAAGVAMTDAVAAQLPGHRVGLKWPNDVLVDGRKICGILAEVSGGAVIVGTGINTAMSAEQLPVPTATSFAALGVDVDADRLVADYLVGLDAAISGLSRSGDAVGLHAEVTARCLTLGQTVDVSMPDGSTLNGVATRLAADGRLVIDDGSAEHEVLSGDVVHVRLA